MKTQTLEIQRILVRRASGIAVALLLFVSLTAIAFAQPSPAGNTWDCVMSGSRGGIAFLTFNDDGTFDGIEIIVPNPAASIRPSLIQWDVGSNGLGVRPPAAPSTAPTIFGSLPVTGPWGFDNKGRIIGFFTEVVPPLQKVVCSVTPLVTTTQETVTRTQTNQDGSVTMFQTNVVVAFTNFTTSCVTNFTSQGFTNTVNLTGKVVANKRLTLVATTLSGRVTFRGVPASSLPDLSGSWYGIKTQNRLSSFEFFQLSAISDLLNVYQVDGQGPNYSYTNGIAMLSSQKRIAFALAVTDGANFETVRAVGGAFNLRSLKATSTGIEAPVSFIGSTNRMSFRIIKRTSSP